MSLADVCWNISSVFIVITLGVIAILSFLYGAYVMIVFVILYEEHLEKEYE